ncbi:MAG: hypothetical protein RLY87_576 [Chloroflexota bacterium]|jgi:lipopolysaccharide transport system permease protein
MALPFLKKHFFSLSVIIVSVAIAFALVLPGKITAPDSYTDRAQVIIDTEHARELFGPDGKPDADMENILYQTRTAIQRDYPSFGTVELDAALAWDAQTLTITVKGIRPQEVTTVANLFADTFIRTTQAAGGREILRNLLGWETVRSLKGEPARTEYEQILRSMVQDRVFTFAKPIEVVTSFTPFEDLSDANRSDILREMEFARQTLFLESAASTSPEYVNGHAIRIAHIDSFIRTAEAQFPQTAFDPTSTRAISRSVTARAAETVPVMAVWVIFVLALGGGLVFAAVFLVIDRSIGIVARVREIWSFRILISLLVRRSLQMRYRGRVVGFAWSQVAPIMQLCVYWVVYGYIFDQSKTPMFPIFLAVALLPWSYTTDSVSHAVRCLWENYTLVRKAYFPREVLPIASVLSSLANYLLTLPMLFVFMFVYRYVTTGDVEFPLPWSSLYFPVILFLHTLFILGLSLFLAGMSVVTLDTIHVTGIVLHLWFFLTPVMYSMSNIPYTYARYFRWINPMASFIEYYREIFYGQIVAVGSMPTPNIPASDSLLRSLVTSLVVFIVGYWVFNRMQTVIIERM